VTDISLERPADSRSAAIAVIGDQPPEFTLSGIKQTPAHLAG
jgi:hypothetical protein